MSDLEHERESQGVSLEVWQEATRHCFALRVERVVPETHDAVSILLEIPEDLAHEFAYEAGQFLSFKVPYEGRVLGRSYSLSSSPHTDGEHKVTVKRVEDGRISNWMNDRVRDGSTLMVVPPAGLFVLDPDSPRDLLLFAGGSGITPCISILKTALASSTRTAQLVYANRDARSIIFEAELEALRERHPGRLHITHSLDDTQGFLGPDDVRREVGDALDRDVYLCGPAAFMDTVEHTLREMGVARERIHIERFVSPPDEHETPPLLQTVETEGAPGTIQVVLDGETRDIPYRAGEPVLEAARRAGLDPPFSCEEGYCSCCMARLESGDVKMAANDCLTPELVAEGWVLTCQSRCVGGKIRIVYPD